MSRCSWQMEKKKSEETSVMARFAANLAHEIRNPLSNIQLNASLLERKVLGNDSAEALAKRITNGIRKLDRMIAGLIAYAATPTPNLAAIDLRTVILDSLEFVSFWVEDAKIQLAVDLGDGECLIRGDSQQLQQVFLNLVLNAIQAIQKRTEDAPEAARKLSIRLVPKSSSVWAEIEDTGCGIKQEHLKEIFKPLFTTKKNGTGLGLSIVRSILRQHRGMIRCRSVEGEGSCFQIRFRKAHLE